jgi:hypothetical protein
MDQPDWKICHCLPVSAEVLAPGINGQTGHEPATCIGFKGKLEKLSDRFLIWESNRKTLYRHGKNRKTDFSFEKIAGENTSFIERAYMTLSVILPELITDRTG